MFALMMLHMVAIIPAETNNNVYRCCLVQ